MMISERAQNMPSSPIRKLAKYADAAKRNGVHVYHLNIGQPDILTPEGSLVFYILSSKSLVLIGPKFLTINLFPIIQMAIPSKDKHIF